MMRRFLIGLGAVVVLVAAAALIGPSFVDWNSYKPEITAQAKSITGRDLVIDGDLSLTLLPTLRLSVRGARFANLKGGSVPDMARLKALDIKVRLLPLLNGRFEAESITLIEPEIVLERFADGRVNWDFTASQGGRPTAPGAPAEASRAGSEGGAQAVRLDNLRIRNGTVIYRDAVARTEERISGLTVQLVARSLNGPFEAKGDVTVRGVPLTFETAVGELKPTAAAPLSLLVAVPSAKAKAELSGSAAIIGATPRFTGKMSASGTDLRRLAAALSGQSRTALPAALAQPFVVKASLKGSDGSGSIDNLEMELGGTRASGGVTITAAKRVRAEAKLRITRVDLDAWLAKKDPDAGSSGAATPPAEKPGSATPAGTARAPFALPDFDATLNAEVAAVTYNRQNIRNISLQSSLSGGIARLEKMAFFLPGGGEAALDGILSAVKGKPHFQGKIDAQADNLRTLLRWLGIDMQSVPSVRLRKFAFSASFSGDDEQVHLLGAKISVDTTRIDGGVTLALRDRVAFGATVNVDSLDIDAYVPRETAAARPTAATGAGSPAASGAPAAARGPLAALNDFDANVRLRIGRLTARQTQVRDVRFDGTLVGGVMTVRNASVGNIGGARAAVSGTLGNFAGIPVFKGSVSADARDIGGILRLAGIAPPQGARSLGALKLRGKADARADLVDLDLTLDAAGASIKVKGTASGLNAAPRVDATLTAAHGDLSRLMRTLGAEPPAKKLGPFSLSAQLKGGLDRIATSVSLKAAGGALSWTGTVTSLATAPAFDLQIDVSHPSVGDLARAFAPDYRPVGGRIGPLKVSAAVKGAKSEYALTALTASAGKVTLRGSGRLSTGGARPTLKASMTAGEIDLNPFLPPDAAAAGQPQPASRSSAQAPANRPSSVGPDRFSAHPFDMSALGLIDADLSVDAKAMIYRQFRVDSPTIKGTLADGLLTVKEIAGKMFDGTFQMVGRLDARRTPALEGNITVQKAKIGSGLLRASAFDISSGVTDFTMQVSGSGISPRAMIGALNGSGRIASRDGILKGFDLQAVSDRLKRLNEGIDLLALLGSAFRGGQTRFSSLDGTFLIRNGVVSSNDIRLVANAGEGHASGSVDLPRWYMDVNTQFRLTEHSKAPPFGVRLVGPIDNPEKKPEAEKLVSFFMQRGIGLLLRKAFPDRGKQQAPATQSAPDQPQPQQQRPGKPRIEDILPGLLKGLGR